MSWVIVITSFCLFANYSVNPLIDKELLKSQDRSLYMWLRIFGLIFVSSLNFRRNKRWAKIKQHRRKKIEAFMKKEMHHENNQQLSSWRQWETCWGGRINPRHNRGFYSVLGFHLLIGSHSAPSWDCKEARRIFYFFYKPKFHCLGGRENTFWPIDKL